MKSQHMFTALAAAMLSLGAYSTAANAADLANCTVCHSNITKAHAGAAHKDVACTSCHTGLDEHLKKPSARPTGQLRRLPSAPVHVALQGRRPSRPSVEEGCQRPGA